MKFYLYHNNGKRLKEHILRNHSYSCRPMFVDCQNFAGSWGWNFVGNWFIALQCKTIFKYLVKHLLGRKFVGKGNPRNPRTFNPHEQL